MTIIQLAFLYLAIKIFTGYAGFDFTRVIQKRNRGEKFYFSQLKDDKYLKEKIFMEK